MNDNKMYKYIFNNAPIGIIYYDKKGIITACNNKFTEIIGSPREKLIGFNMNELPDKYFGRAIQKSLKGEIGKYEGEYITHTSGKTIPIRAQFHPFNENGVGTGNGIGMFEDISERFYAKRKLRESEERYRTIFNNDHKVMLLINLEDGAIEDANPAAIKYYGWTLDEITSMKITDINILSAREIQKEVEKAKMEEKNVFRFKHRIADGSIRDVEVYSGMIKIDGQLYLYSIVNDISERIQDEHELQKFKLGMERTSNIVFITDTDGYIEYINPSFTKSYGYTLKDVKGKTPRILKSSKQDQQFYKKFWDTIVSGEVMSGEVVNKTKDGRLLNISFSSNPIINDENRIIGYIAIQEDITGQKKKDEQILNSLEEKKVLLSEIHHRVKNNLAIISGLLELNLYMDEKISTEEMIKSSQQRIKAMANVHEMLYQSENFSQISFKEYTERLIDYIKRSNYSNEFKPIFITHFEDVELNVNQAIPVGLILNELLSNALKHAFPNKNEGTIEITIYGQENFVTIEVGDNGIGISDSEHVGESSLGMTLIKILSQQLSGDLEMGNSTNGFKCTLTFERKLEVKGSSMNFV